MDFKVENDKLYIQKGGRWESIGTLRERVLFVSRNFDTQLMKFDNSYGFDRNVINSQLFDYVSILESKAEQTNKYLVPIDWIFTHGRKYQAPNQDVQLFVKWEALQEFKQN